MEFRSAVFARDVEVNVASPESRDDLHRGCGGGGGTVGKLGGLSALRITFAIG